MLMVTLQHANDIAEQDSNYKLKYSLETNSNSKIILFIPDQSSNIYFFVDQCLYRNGMEPFVPATMANTVFPADNGYIGQTCNRNIWER